MELVELSWQTTADEKTAIFVSRPKAVARPALLELELEGVRIEVGPQRRKVTFGRDLEADFPVRNALVSRAHAMIERRREHFVLVDHSSNGSFVSFEGKPEIQVNHEELTLVGQGCIAFGQPRGEAAQVVNFRCA